MEGDVWRMKTHVVSNTRLTISALLVILLVVIICGCGSQSPDRTLQDETGAYWGFRTGKDAKFEGRVLPYPPTINAGMGTVVKGCLRFCTEKAYHIREEQYKKKGKCCKPFYRKYSTTFFLLTYYDEIERVLKTMKEGDKIELDGQRLHLLGFYNSEGKKIESSGGYRGHEFFYVKQMVFDGTTYGSI